MRIVHTMIPMAKFI